MAGCIDETSLEYQRLRREAGIPDLLLKAAISYSLDNKGRLPSIHEIPRADSKPFLVSKLGIKDDAIGTYAKLDTVLQATGTQSLDEAMAYLNSQYNDYEFAGTVLGDMIMFSKFDRKASRWETRDIERLPDTPTNGASTVNRLIHRLSTIYGYRILTTSDAAITRDFGDLAGNLLGKKAFIYNGDIYINTSAATVEDPVHEFTHLMAGSLRATDRAQYDAMVNKMENMDGFNTFVQDNPGRQRSDLREEYLVREFSKFLYGESSIFDTLAQEQKLAIMDDILSMFNNALLGKDSPEALKASTFLEAPLERMIDLLQSPISDITWRGNLDLNGAQAQRILSNDKVRLQQAEGRNKLTKNEEGKWEWRGRTFENELALDNALLSAKHISDFGDLVFDDEHIDQAYQVGRIQENYREYEAANVEYGEWRANQKALQGMMDVEQRNVLPPYIGTTKLLNAMVQADGKTRLFPVFDADEYWKRKAQDWMSSDYWSEDDWKHKDKDMVGDLFATGIPHALSQEEFLAARTMFTEKWEAQGKIGTQLHELLKNFWTGQNRKRSDAEIRRYWKNHCDSALVSEERQAELLMYARQLESELTSKFGEDAQFLPEQAMIGNCLGFGVNGRLAGIIDLLVIGKDGSVNIIDYKTSPKMYQDYNSAKVRAFKYQLAVYRRLLHNAGVDLNRGCGVYVAPIQMENLHKEGDNWVYDSVQTGGSILEELTDSILNSHEADGINRNIDLFLPYKKDGSVIPGTIFSYVQDGITKMFPHADISTTSTEMLAADLVNRQEGKLKNSITGKYEFTLHVGKSETLVDDSIDGLIAQVAEKLEEAQARQGENTSYMYNLVRKIIQDGVVPDNLHSYFLRHEGNADEGWLRGSFSKYANGDWMIIDQEGLADMDIIMLANKLTGIVDVIRLSSSDLTRRTSINGDRLMLTAEFEDDVTAKNKPKELMMENYQGNLELMQTMLTINHLHDLFRGNYKIGSIQVMNTQFGESVTASNEQLKYTFNELFKLSGIEGKNYFNDEIHTASFIDLAEDDFRSIMHVFYGEEHDWKHRNSTWRKMYEDGYQFSLFRNSTPHQFDQLNPVEKRAQLIALKNDLEKRFSKLSGSLSASDLNQMTAAENRIYNNIMLAIADIDGYKFKQQLKDHEAYLESVKLFKEGMHGTMVDNMGNLLSDTLNSVGDMVSVAYQNIRSEMQNHLAKTRKLVEELKREKGMTYLGTRTFANQATLYEGMFEETENDLIFVDPDKSSDPRLGTAAKNFLREALWQINKDRYRGVSDETLRDWRDSNDAEKHYKYYKAPVQFKRAQANSLSSLLAQTKDWLTTWTPSEIMKRVDGIIDPKVRDGVKTGSMWEMTNTFDAGNGQHRNSVIDHIGVNNLETNVETLLLQHTYAYSQQRALNEIFPTIKAAMIHLASSGVIQNNHFLDDFKYLQKYIRAKIFNQSLVDEKYQPALKIVNTLMMDASRLALAFSPKQLYQLLDGVWKDIQLVFRDPDFTMRHVWESFVFAYRDMLHFGDNKSQSELLNELYGLNDMDMNTFVDRVKSDNVGLWNFWSLGFRFAARPDFYNRLTIFGAQMRKDGSWEAHSVENGKLVYNWKKDKRFAAFANEDHSDEDAYNRAKALYMVVARQLEAEHTKNEDGTDFVFDLQAKHALPKAYTTKESEAMKALADKTYGYYSHERKSLMQSEFLGGLFMQMTTYWSSKKNQYLQQGGIQLEGKYDHYYETVTDPETGEAKQVYYYLAKDGVTPVTADDPESSGIPFMVWRGKYGEGILLTLSQLYQATRNYGIKEGWAHIWNNENESLRNAYRANLKQFTSDLIIAHVMGTLVGGSLHNAVAAYAAANPSSKSLENALANCALLFVDNVWNLSTDDANAFKSITGKITNLQPFSLSTLGRLIDNWSEFFFDDRSFMDAVKNSSTALKQFKPIFEYAQSE